MSELRITADSHVGEPEELLERIPEALRKHMPKLDSYDELGSFVLDVEGYRLDAAVIDPLTEEDWDKEFRSDDKMGQDLEVRLRDVPE